MSAATREPEHARAAAKGGGMMLLLLSAEDATHIAAKIEDVLYDV